jgi:putative transcriptional regulator
MRDMAIKWRLRQVMAERNISGKALALSVGLQATQLSRLRTRDTMPKLTEERLDSFCKALQCQPGDLLVYSSEEVVVND